MTKRYPPINPKCPHFLHGGDYNPDQWPPEVWDEDVRLMNLARCNAMSVGIFSWTQLEPEEGKFTFGWLDRIMDMLAANGAFAVLATPSGARPAWMSQKYPEVLRVSPERVRNLHGKRHNHCFTSPVYREKCRIINRQQAERYKDHPALLVWHVSNEYGGECHCDLCQEAFRAWLKAKFGNDLAKLNHAYWTAFWSHTYTDWSQIESPSPRGEQLVHGLNLDWKRFVTEQTVDFMNAEIQPLRELTPDTPITTNFMGFYPGLNYWKFDRVVDVVSWDSYPQWHKDSQGVKDWDTAATVAFTHDLNRSLKRGRPFMLMESTPSMTNWQPVAKLKRPGMHRVSSLQAVAHGADTVQYFQWRKSRGSSEKFHGAVVDHSGHENTRVFREVAEVGDILAKLDDVIGTTAPAEVAVIYDWENRWAIDDAKGPRIEKKAYLETCVSHYRSFWRRGVTVDAISMDCDFSSYKLLVAPMLYMVRPGVAERIEAFVKKGGVFVATYWSGIVDENDLCFLGGFPGPLRKVLGVWAEEIDALYDGDSNRVATVKGNALGLRGKYKARVFCDLVHAEFADTLAIYEKDFYAGRPALTANNFGKGKAFYIAFRSEDKFLDNFYDRLMDELELKRAVEANLPEGVTAQRRAGGGREFVFLLNFAPKTQNVNLKGATYTDVLTGKQVSGGVKLAGYASLILEPFAAKKRGGKSRK